MEKTITCLRCDRPMNLIKQEHLFLGKVGLQFGDLHYTPSRGLDVDVWCCPECGKLELFRTQGPEEAEEGSIAQAGCAICGSRYDLDSPKCPVCGTKNPNW